MSEAEECHPFGISFDSHDELADHCTEAHQELDHQRVVFLGAAAPGSPTRGTTMAQERRAEGVTG